MPKMTVTKEQASNLFKAVGIVIADKWDAAKLMEKLKTFDKIQGVEEKVEGIEDENLQTTGRKVLAACARTDVKIVVTEASVPEGGAPKEKAVSDKPTKPKKEEKKPAKPVKPEKPAAKKEEKGDKPKAKKESTVKKDPWGTREGTRTARINAVLLKGKPYTIAEIEKHANAHGISSHLTKLKAQGLIDKDANGKYQITKAGAKKAGK